MEISTCQSESEIKPENETYFVVACRSVDGAALKHCFFTMPDGTIIVGDIQSRYTFLDTKDVGECGLKVESPVEEDFGVWTCSAVIARQNGTVQSYARITVKRREVVEEDDDADEGMVNVHFS